MNINAQARQLISLVLDMKVEVKKETPDLLSLPIRLVCGISQQSHKSLHKSSGKFDRSLIFWNFFQKTIPPIYRNGGSSLLRILSNTRKYLTFPKS
jgi:hypothetical protein